MSIPIMSHTKELPEYEKVGLEDGGVVHFKCSCCAKPLLDVQITRPNYKLGDGSYLEGNYKCKCPYCGNFSKEEFIRGGIATTNIADDNEQVLCYMDDFDIVNGVTIFNIKKNKREQFPQTK